VARDLRKRITDIYGGQVGSWVQGTPRAVILLNCGMVAVNATAATLHSLARIHALVDGNKRLAWTACRTFLAINAQWISAPEDERFDFVIGVATGAMSDLDEIAARLRSWSYQEG
jgi:hypothetical protein